MLRSWHRRPAPGCLTGFSIDVALDGGFRYVHTTDHVYTLTGTWQRDAEKQRLLVTVVAVTSTNPQTQTDQQTLVGLVLRVAYVPNGEAGFINVSPYWREGARNRDTLMFEYPNPDWPYGATIGWS